MLAIRELIPNWRDLAIHESSPENRGLSRVLATEAPGYTATQFWPDVPPGEQRNGVRCENLEAQTFASEGFDLVVTQDVMEHVFHPAKAYQEIYRTLRPGGYHIHTTPIYKGLTDTIQRASLGPSGAITHLSEAEYHGNPISSEGSLVTYHYGYDLADLIASWAPFDVEIRRFHDRTHGIVAEFSEVIICYKPSQCHKKLQNNLFIENIKLKELLRISEEAKNQLGVDLRGIRASTSWRVTAPLRWVKQTISKP